MYICQSQSSNLSLLIASWVLMFISFILEMLKHAFHQLYCFPLIAPSEVKVTQSCPALFEPMDYTVHGILQARILEWVACPFSRGSSQTRDQTQVSHIEGRFFTSWATEIHYIKCSDLDVFLNWQCLNKKLLLNIPWGQGEAPRISKLKFLQKYVGLLIPSGVKDTIT